MSASKPCWIVRRPGETDESGAGVDGGRLATSLVTATEALRSLAVLLNPITPKAAAGLWELLGAEASLGALDAQPLDGAGAFGVLPAGTTVTKGAALFPRLEEQAV